MRGGHTPIHIMRLAPADYVNDPFVRRLYQRGDYRTAAFYPVFLFYSHMEGGDLPADVQILSSTVLMPSRDVAAAIRVCKRAGKIHEENGRLFHRRVRREVQAELDYRRHQSELGKKGGRPKKEEGRPKGPLLEHESPPAPLPAPAPAPLPAPAPSPLGEDAGANGAGPRPSPENPMGWITDRGGPARVADEFVSWQEANPIEGESDQDALQRWIGGELPTGVRGLLSSALYHARKRRGDAGRRRPDRAEEV
jgi:hypothetical protein